MKKIKLIIVAACLICACTSFGQQIASDSAQVAKAFKELLSICKNVDFADPKTLEIGTFYKAGVYIVYRGEDAKRKWKDTANYANEEEKKQVDEICFKINNSVNHDANYTITGYRQQKESEGTWHGLMVSYIRKGVKKNAIFAFLKIKGRFALGDID